MVKRALGTSISLHLALATLVAGLRSFAPVSANVPMEPGGIPGAIMVDWRPQMPAESPQPTKIPSNKAPVAEASPLPTSNSETSFAGESSPAQIESSHSGQNIGDGATDQKRILSAEEAYMASLKRELERRKHYPAMARRLGHTGRVTVFVKIQKDGSVVDSAVVEPSPYDTLNQAAAQILQALPKLQPIPEELNKVSWQFTVPIEYILE